MGAPPRPAQWVVQRIVHATDDQLVLLGSYRDAPPPPAVQEAAAALMSPVFYDEVWSVVDRLTFAAVNRDALSAVPKIRAQRKWTERSGLNATLLMKADVEAQGVVACLMAGGAISEWARGQLLAAWAYAGLEVPR